MQQNYCVSLSLKSKSHYYKNLNENIICDNLNSLPWNKIVSNEKITLVEGKELLKPITETQKD